MNPVRLGLWTLCLFGAGIGFFQAKPAKGPQPASPPCPEFETGVSRGWVKPAFIDEASGIVASRDTPGVFWVHNDSGDISRVFAIDEAGTLLATCELACVDARDWEDISIGPGPEPDRDYLYIGDVGDNKAKRDLIHVYRVPEPRVDPTKSGVSMMLNQVETITLAFPDHPRDVETLMVDPLSGDLYLISKRETPSRIYRVPYPQSTTSTNELQLVGTLPWGWAVGGDISPDGQWILIKGYFNAGLWRKQPGQPLWSAFAQEQCQITLRSEPQGEAIGFRADGCGFYTLSEHINQPLYYYKPLAPCTPAPVPVREVRSEQGR
ncbi:hypothetical protein SCOR_24900 [Sulfidibacter corallicola]|uniref:Uncharacterized protein n=1 Tax=Sulfidibacter corallicola TaxID=2818388 RepID=A0A8A4TTI0_SULCO|nr:hypothetical protein [Sulfidibacter corallicola]QTD52352.1 hypothetical protein J3U87_07755 [Sulfidibacter corallicola]